MYGYGGGGVCLIIVFDVKWYGSGFFSVRFQHFPSILCCLLVAFEKILQADNPNSHTAEVKFTLLPVSVLVYNVSAN